MFVTNEKNRLPSWRTFLPDTEGLYAWSAIEPLFPVEVLILTVSRARSRGVPNIVMLDLRKAAPSLAQFLDGGFKLRGAAVLSTSLAERGEQWTLDPLSEIRVGVTESEQNSEGERLWTVTRFTTAAGCTFSVPCAPATRPSRGRRLWRPKKPAAPADC